MKKILIIIPSLGMGGLERMLVNIANRLVCNGHCVTVMNLTFHDEKIKEMLDNRVKYLGGYNPKKFFTRASVKDLLGGNIRFLPKEKWMIYHSAKYVHQAYVKEKFDTEIAFYYGDPAKIVSGAPKSVTKIFWAHDTPSKIIEKDNNQKRMKSEKQAVDMMDILVCVSAEFVSEMRDKYTCAEIVHIPNLNDVERILSDGGKKVEGVEKKRFTVVFVGRIVINNKGLDRLLDAVEKLNQDGLPYDLWVIGDGVDLEKVMQLTAAKSLENVYILGRRDNPYPYIKAADILVLSSRWEAYGLVMAESIILGTPVLATDCDGSRDILDNGQYGMLVPNSTDGIYEGLKKMMTDCEIYNYYHRMTDKRQDFFNTERIASQIEEIL